MSTATAGWHREKGPLWPNQANIDKPDWLSKDSSELRLYQIESSSRAPDIDRSSPAGFAPRKLRPGWLPHKNLTVTVATFRSWRGWRPVLCAGPEPSSPRKANLARRLAASAGNSAPLERVVGTGHR